jgi:hypothetical protein
MPANRAGKREKAMEETKTLYWIGRYEIAVQQYVRNASDGLPYTYEGSNYDFETEDEAREAAEEHDRALCREQDKREHAKALCREQA